jgi:hypothetical protein
MSRSPQAFCSSRGNSVENSWIRLLCILGTEAEERDRITLRRWSRSQGVTELLAYF